MKKQFIVVCIAILAFMSCQKEQGKPLITFRNVNSKTIVTVKGAYLYIQSDSNTVVGVDNVPSSKLIYSYFQNQDTTITEYGHCWSVVNAKPTLEKDFHISASNIQGKTGTVLVTNLMQELRFFTTYYVRPYVKTKRIISHNSLTGTDSILTDIGYGLVDTFTTSGLVNSWAKRNSMGIGARQGAVSFVIGDSLAFVGTGDVNGTYTNDLWRYSQNGDSWTQCAVASYATKTMQARKDAVAFVIGNRGYIATGLAKGTTSDSPLKDCWAYNATANAWTRVNDFAGSARSNAVAFAIGNYGYIGTGEGATAAGGVTTNSTFYEYDSSGDSWRKVADFKERTGAVSFVLNGKAYVGTGYGLNADEITYSLKKDMWIFTPPETNANDGIRSEGSWSQLADFGQGAEVSAGTRKNATAIVINGSAYIGYGEAEDGSFYRDWFKYTQSTDTWALRQMGSSGGEKRKNAIAFALGFRGYFGTGYDGNNLYREDLWEYIPDDAVLNKK